MPGTEIGSVARISTTERLLGSAENEECRIDSIAQAWSVISGGGNPHQATRAMASVDEYLIRRGDGIVLLFTPPFDKGPLNPGYIKGYHSRGS